MLVFLSTSSGAGRDPVAITSREVTGRHPDEPSPRPIWEGKTGCSSASKPRRRESAHTHNAQSVMRLNHTQFECDTLGKNDLRNSHVIEAMWLLFSPSALQQALVMNCSEDRLAKANANYTYGRRMDFLLLDSRSHV